MVKKIHLPVLITSIAGSDPQYEQKKFEAIPEILKSAYFQNTDNTMRNNKWLLYLQMFFCLLNIPFIQLMR